ncbi:hypothetical protein RKE29_23400, partial [Streptomyces sp. B1866]|nr:hypothetical protein [Streptomyces sp. B1866]
MGAPERAAAPSASGKPAPGRPAPDGPAPTDADRSRRARVLARRRRTTSVLFLAFTLGTAGAAIGGLAFLWAPAVPAALLSAYIAYLRRQERHRFAFVMDQRGAELAAQRLRERRPPARPAPSPAAPAEPPARTEPAPPAADTSHPAPRPSSREAGRRALVEQTDHAEWVDQQRDRGPAASESWEPVPVPLPTYVTAPVAPRAPGGVDLGASDAWSSARSSPAGTPSAPAADQNPPPRGPHGRTPLFDQYAHPAPDRETPPHDPGLDRPRAANE